MYSVKYGTAGDNERGRGAGAGRKSSIATRIHGILVQMPVPNTSIPTRSSPRSRRKRTSTASRRRAWVSADRLPGPVSCTPLGLPDAAARLVGDLSEKHAVIVGRSNLVSKPIAQLLLRENCTVTIARLRTADLPTIVRQADILVAAVGRPRMIHGDWIKPGAAVIDVGSTRCRRLTRARARCARSATSTMPAFRWPADHAGSRWRRSADDCVSSPTPSRPRVVD